LNGDGWPDLWVGNDYDEPDVIYLNARGELRPLQQSASPIPQTTDQTMSIDSGDINNDGTLALYESSIADGQEAVKASNLDSIRVRNPAAACDVYADSAQRPACDAVATF